MKKSSQIFMELSAPSFREHAKSVDEQKHMEEKNAICPVQQHLFLAPLEWILYNLCVPFNYMCHIKKKCVKARSCIGCFMKLDLQKLFNRVTTGSFEDRNSSPNGLYTPCNHYLCPLA